VCCFLFLSGQHPLPRLLPPSISITRAGINSLKTQVNLDQVSSLFQYQTMYASSKRPGLLFPRVSIPYSTCFHPSTLRITITSIRFHTLHGDQTSMPMPNGPVVSFSQVSIPYPTCFHPATREEITAHQRLILSANRTVLINFTGQLERDALWWGRNLRQKIAEQCSAQPGDCELVDCGTECYCTTVLGGQLRARFCLQPPGDTPTRRSFFDSLQVGFTSRVQNSKFGLLRYS
jgi:hypothetical protein